MYKLKRYGIRINRRDNDPRTRIHYVLDAEGMRPAGLRKDGRFDLGDWEDIWFVKKNRPVMVKWDGTVDYELDHEDHEKRREGGKSDIANALYEGNAMSEIPLIWVKRFREEENDYIIFCEDQYDETYQAYAHRNREGKVLRSIYLPMYEGTLWNGKLRSISGKMPASNLTDPEETRLARENGIYWDKLAFSDVNLMHEMCAMISGSTDSQTSFGNGSCKPDYFIPAGTLSGKGQFYGTVTEMTQGVKMFYCENFYGNYWKRIQGVLMVDGKYWVKPYPPYDNGRQDYLRTELCIDGASGEYVSEMSFAGDIGRLPTGTTSDDCGYECSRIWYQDSKIRLATFGGDCGDENACGLSCWAFYNGETCKRPYFTSSIVCKARNYF